LPSTAERRDTPVRRSPVGMTTSDTAPPSLNQTRKRETRFLLTRGAEISQTNVSHKGASNVIDKTHTANPRNRKALLTDAQTSFRQGKTYENL
jgi:hypothetical protein